MSEVSQEAVDRVIRDYTLTQIVELVEVSGFHRQEIVQSIINQFNNGRNLSQKQVAVLARRAALLKRWEAEDREDDFSQYEFH